MFQCKHQHFKNLRWHYEKVHAKSSETCSHCNKKFADLKGHLKFLNLKKTFSCEICGDLFKQKASLNRHKNVVHNFNTVPVDCPQCKKVFNWDKGESDRLLEQHIRLVHEGSKLFACEICGVKMSQYFNLDDHRKKVHGEKKIPIDAYRNMIKSGKYEFLKDIPTNITSKKD